MSTRITAWRMTTLFLLIVSMRLLWLPGLDSVVLRGYDELFQLALGLKVAHGAWPGVDFFTNYGPGVSMLSALSWTSSNPIFVEILVNSVLISIGLFAFWRFGSVPGRPGNNLILLALLVAVTPPWPKYYYLLWPGLFLFTLGDPCAVRSPRAQQVQAVLLGLLIGLGGWFRLEIGLALAATLCGASALKLRTEPSSLHRQGGQLLLSLGAAILPWALYFSVASLAKGKWQGPLDLLDFYFVSTLAKSTDFRSMAGIPTGHFAFDVESMMSYLGVIILTGNALILLFCWPRGKNRRTASPTSRRAWCAAVLLFCLSPQALHRIDAQHTLHIIAPGLVGILLALAALNQRRVVQALLGVLICLEMRLFYLTSPRPSTAPARLRSLVGGIKTLAPSSADLQLAAATRRVAAARGGNTILIPSIDTRLSVIVGLPFGGILPHWSFRLPERWQHRQIEALRHNPPPVVIYADFYRSSTGHSPNALDFRGRNPLLDAYIDETYPETTWRNPSWHLLVKSLNHEP